MRHLIGAWRLLRTFAHVLHGTWVVWREFGAASEATRCAHIQWWSAKLLQVLGVRLQPMGRFEGGPQLIVANHISWLDIAAIHAVCPQARFVSKSDVKEWPLLGWLIGSAGTLFIERASKRDALRVVHQMAAALQAGDTVAVFPEGTTGTGHTLLPFHANLLQAVLPGATPVQPVVLRYAEPGHAVSPAVAFVGDTTLVGSIWAVVCARGLSVEVEVLARQPSAGLDRRAVSQLVSDQIAARLAR
ncbi:lysophospholipid acyltransferase family protein [Sphaerotilus mobilis]|uniref:Lyso-ornithine lipid acyltransferase n=1 Tax=Sphaerotilus mobilis TaxID=47994 RepID=A0A4Q7LLX8_9BURK|nr:lysophospholipid acyltransferase family protein [Sphaerotilus mobilis]RZS54658.1 lyso-ornithine lipid acyltransferase [Sphaerotilus mobilis]